ncbi:MAG: hemagglutinin repeat-containing protein, partial [Holosporaceae bacterium]|nr:hemagglutinin repeat-containing protein [Holosporaceae bacterium]
MGVDTIDANEVINNSSKISAVNNVNIKSRILMNIKPTYLLENYINYSEEDYYRNRSGDFGIYGSWSDWHKVATNTTKHTQLLTSLTAAIISGANVEINATITIMNDAYQITAENKITVNNKGVNKVVESAKNTGTMNPLDLIFGELGAVGGIENLGNVVNANIGAVNNTGGLTNIGSINQIGFEYAKPDSNYLFQNNNRFLNEYDFIGSKYFTDRMGINPDKAELKFIGDSIYEQYLVEKMIQEATGYRYLKESILDTNTQMIELYEAALKEQSKIGFEFGKELSQEQIDKLDEDIIWYAQTKVSETMYVLVPMLYLGKNTRASLNDSSKSKVQALNTVKLLGGDLENSGEILGKNVDIDMTGNASNIDGKIYGENSLGLKVGGDILNISTVETKQYGENVVSKMNGLGSIGSGGVLNLEAGGLLGIFAGEIYSVGDASIKANEMLVTTQELYDETHTYAGDTKTTERSLTHEGSNLSFGGNLNLEVTNDANILGSEVNVGKNADIKVGGDMNIMSVEEILEIEKIT